MSNARNVSKLFSLSAAVGALLSLASNATALNSIASNATALNSIAAQPEAPGVVKDFAGTEAKVPAGYLPCDGRAVSRTTYAALFDAIGTAWGVGDGTTTFNLPDLRGRTTAGKDNMGGTAASRLTTAAGGVDGATLGASGGTSTHALTVAQMPTHNHGVNDPGHAHNITALANYVAPSTFNSGYDDLSSRGGSVAGHVIGNTTGISIQNNGSGAAHPNVQPTAVVNKIIKT